MKKNEIIKAYDSFLKRHNLTPNQAILAAGAACVMHGIREETSDMDIHVRMEFFCEQLSRHMQLYGNSPHVKCYYVSDEEITYDTIHQMEDNVDIFTVRPMGEYRAIPVKYEVIDGVCVYSLEQTLKHKRLLSRDKDLNDIIELEKRIMAERA